MDWCSVVREVCALRRQRLSFATEILFFLLRPALSQPPRRQSRSLLFTVPRRLAKVFWNCAIFIYWILALSKGCAETPTVGYKYCMLWRLPLYH